jgi:hypothetical protein
MTGKLAAHVQSDPRLETCCASTREAVSKRLKLSKNFSRSCAENNLVPLCSSPTHFAADSLGAAFAGAKFRGPPQHTTGFRRARPSAVLVDQGAPTRGSGSHRQTGWARSTAHSSEPCCSLDRTGAGPDSEQSLEPCASVARAHGRGPIKVRNPLSMNDSHQ